MDEFERWIDELRRMPPEALKRHLAAALGRCRAPSDIWRLYRRGS